MISMIPKVMKERKKRVITVVQKYMRGYNAYNKYKDSIRQFRLRNNFKFFDKIRKKLLVDSQIKIRYHWFRYKKWKELHRRKPKKQQQKKKVVYYRS